MVSKATKRRYAHREKIAFRGINQRNGRSWARENSSVMESARAFLKEPFRGRVNPICLGKRPRRGKNVFLSGEAGRAGSAKKKRPFWVSLDFGAVEGAVAQRSKKTRIASAQNASRKVKRGVRSSGSCKRSRGGRPLSGSEKSFETLPDSCIQGGGGVEGKTGTENQDL